jgi:alpha-beta hydrolase superfamily lysophospholipase
MFDALINYFKGNRCHFYMTPSGKDRNEAVVLVHGLIRRSLDLYVLGKYLRNHGYTVYVYDYKTTIKGIDEHGAELKKYLEKVVNEIPSSMKLNIVTHSMGGIITRIALKHLAGTFIPDGEILTRKKIKRIVMLAPPNSGSDAAKHVIKYLPFTKDWLKPLPELSSAPDSPIHAVPEPQGLDIGIIAGRFDLQVARKYTPLHGQRNHTVMPSEHSLIMYMPHVKKAVLHYLEHGTFK